MKRLLFLFLFAAPIVNAGALHDIIAPDSTDYSVTIKIIDSADGTPETGVEHNSTGIDLWYRREAATLTAITEAALTALDDAHSDGGIEHISDGEYRLDLPDAAVATGANFVDFGGHVDGMIVIGGRVNLTLSEESGLAAAVVAALGTGSGLTALATASALAVIDGNVDQLIELGLAAEGSCDSGDATTCVDDALVQANDIWRGFGIYFPVIKETSCVYDFVASTDTLSFWAVQTTISTQEYLLFPSPLCKAAIDETP
jgi:hypothetical protein